MSDYQSASNESAGLRETGAESAFIRQSTGLVRRMGAGDALIYNAMICGIVVIAGLTFLIIPFAFPKANLWLAFIVAGVLAVPMIAAYAMLGASMPRSGGDYVFQSRLLHPAIACALILSGYVIWMAFWEALDGWLFSVLAVSPFASLLGVHTGTSWLVRFGSWTDTPWGITVITLAGFAMTVVLLVRGIRFYVRIQAVLWALSMLSFVVIWVLLLTHSHADFVNGINSYIRHYSGKRNFYGTVIKQAHAAGYSGGSSFADTLGSTAVIWTGVAWAMWSVVNAGEVKGAQRIRGMMVSMQGALWLNCGLLAITAALLVHTIGMNFLGSIGYLYYTGGTALTNLPTSPFFGIIVSVLTSNSLVLVLIALGFLANGVQILFGVAWGGSRIILAMSFDRVLPASLGDVHPRLHVPLKAMAAFFAMAIVWTYLYNHTVVTKYTLAVTLASIFVYLGTMAAAVVFPWRAPELYRRSPASKYEWRGIPLISVVGALGFAVNALMAWYYFTHSRLFVNDRKSMEIVFGLIIFSGVYYFLRIAWLKRKGYETALTFKLIPPE